MQDLGFRDLGFRGLKVEGMEFKVHRVVDGRSVMETLNPKP